MTENNKISEGMKIVTVIPLKKGIFKNDLTYFTSKNVRNGSIVTIPVRNKKILGLAVSCEDATLSKRDIKDMSFNLRKIIEVKEHSIFRDEFLESTLLLSSYFSANKNSGIISLTPSVFRENYSTIEKIFTENDFVIKSSEKSKIIKIEKLLFQARLEERISYYKTLIRGQFALKKSVFIVLPTEFDIDLFYQALSKGIENFTFAIHNGLNPKKILSKYEEILSSSHGVLILGTAQFLSIPRNDIGTIIIEHESSNAYKMIPRPHFDLRLFAEIYASKIGAKLILSDTLLRYETIARKELDGLSEVYPMSFRTNFDGVNVEIISTNKEDRLEESSKGFRIFSENQLKEIDNSIKTKKSTLIFSLRKGLATNTVCKDCNDTVVCEKCLAPVVLYLSKDGKKRMFICNKCNTEKDPQTKCENCGSWNLMPLGIGTDTVYEEIKGVFPKVKIYKLDKETVRNSKDAEKIINEFEKNPGSILISTEMVFFYIKEKVDLSIIASFDSLWSIPNYKISEKIIHILISILSKTKERCVIQTKNRNDSALLAIKSENLLSFIRDELKDRKILNYPPYKRFIKITYQGDKSSSIEAKVLLSDLLKRYDPDIFGGFLTKNRNLYATNALIKLETKDWSLPEISSDGEIDLDLKRILDSLSFPFDVAVDPEDLL